VLRYPTQTNDATKPSAVTLTNRIGQAGPWSAPRDEELLSEYAATGNRLAFEELVRRFERELYNYLRNHLGDAQLAEDAFQATFLQLHLKCHQFTPGRPLRPWLYTIANNQATDILRRNRRHKAVSLSAMAGDIGFADQRQSLADLLEAADGDPSQQIACDEDCQKTRSAVEHIPAKLRQVLDLVAFQGLKHREAAAVLGIPLGTVKSRMNKAMRILHTALLSIGHAASH
jgi:RNA polymerase sigma-70 factor, ECF subfamily